MNIHNHKSDEDYHDTNHAQKQHRCRPPHRRRPSIWLLIFVSLVVISAVFLSSKLLIGVEQVDTVSDTQQSLPVSEPPGSEEQADTDTDSDAQQSLPASEPPSGEEQASDTQQSQPTSEPPRESESSQDEASTVIIQQAEEILSGMTLHEKICQLFIVYPETITGASPALTTGEETSDALVSWPVGGFLYEANNMQNQNQVKLMLDNVQSYAKIPMILTCDEEGGRVNRLMSSVGTTYIGPMLSYKDQGIETARKNARTIATDMSSLGFNMDLAPVADVWSNVNNSVIGDRAYSDDFQQASELVSAAVQGFHDGGVACTLKHFPGHGDTATDTHDTPAYVNKPLDKLRSNELVPFQAGINAGTDAVMVSHIIVTEVNKEPALFSYELITRLLRQEMGFQGVVITDGLQMRAISDYYTDGQVAVKALNAGVDILLCPGDLGSAVAGLKHVVETGEMAESRIDESVRRILTLKLEHGIIQANIS